MKPDTKHRAAIQRFRKILGLTREELAVLAGVSLKTVDRFERCKQMSPIIEERVTKAVFMAVAKKNSGTVKQATQPALEAADKWQQILYVGPGSEAALELERLSGQSLSELKAQAEKVASFLRGISNAALSLTK